MRYGIYNKTTGIIDENGDGEEMVFGSRGDAVHALRILNENGVYDDPFDWEVRMYTEGSQ